MKKTKFPSFVYLKLDSTVSPKDRLDRFWYQYLWYFYEKHKFNIIKASKDAGVKVYFFKNQLRLNPILVKKVLTSCREIYETRNKKSKLEILIESMLVKGKDPREASAYKFGSLKTKKEIDIILANNEK